MAISTTAKVVLGEKLSVPARSYSHERAQYLSTDLLDVLAPHARGDERIRLGITNVDLFVPELNFVFGEASSARRVAVFSTARLKARHMETQRMRRCFCGARRLRQCMNSAMCLGWVTVQTQAA